MTIIDSKIRQSNKLVRKFEHLKASGLPIDLLLEATRDWSELERITGEEVSLVTY